MKVPTEESIDLYQISTKQNGQLPPQKAEKKGSDQDDSQYTRKILPSSSQRIKSKFQSILDVNAVIDDEQAPTKKAVRSLQSQQQLIQLTQNMRVPSQASLLKHQHLSSTISNQRQQDAAGDALSSATDVCSHPKQPLGKGKSLGSASNLRTINQLFQNLRQQQALDSSSQSGYSSSQKEVSVAVGPLSAANRTQSKFCKGEIFKKHSEQLKQSTLFDRQLRSVKLKTQDDLLQTVEEQEQQQQQGSQASSTPRNLKFRKLPGLDSESQASCGNSQMMKSQSEQCKRAKMHNVSSPLLSPEDIRELEKSRDKSANLNNLYLKMLDEFQIPYKTNLEEIRGSLVRDQFRFIYLDAAKGSSGRAGSSRQFLEHLLSYQLAHPVSLHIARNKQMKNSSNKAEVEALSKWVDVMVYNIYRSAGGSVPDIFEQVQVVYTACLKELIRQVSIDNLLRGQLFEKIWKSYNLMMEKSISGLWEESKESERLNVEEVSRVHKMYSQEIEMYKQQSQAKNSELEEQKSLEKILKQTVRYFKKNNKTINEHLFKLKFDLESQLDQYKKLEVEYRNTKKDLDDLQIAHSQKQYIQRQKEDEQAQQPGMLGSSPKHQASKPISLAAPGRKSAVLGVNGQPSGQAQGRAPVWEQGKSFMGGEYVLEKNGNVSIKVQVDLTGLGMRKALKRHLKQKRGSSGARAEQEAEAFSESEEADVDEKNLELWEDSEPEVERHLVLNEKEVQTIDLLEFTSTIGVNTDLTEDTLYQIQVNLKRQTHVTAKTQTDEVAFVQKEEKETQTAEFEE